MIEMPCGGSGRLAEAGHTLDGERCGDVLRFCGKDFHFVPVVRKFFAAIQANDVRSFGPRSAVSAPFRGDGKAVVLVPATKKHVKNIG